MKGATLTALSGTAATCTGIGLARFAYVPLFPAMVAAGWVDGAEAGLLGALNLTGYLIGVGFVRALARRGLIVKGRPMNGCSMEMKWFRPAER